MKKTLSVILICMMLIAYATCFSASSQDSVVLGGFEIIFNGEATEHSSVICNDKHYVPMRRVFEMMGATVFYRSRDNSVLALTRDGDTLTHIVGDSRIIANGAEKTFDYPSIKVNDETFISVDMLSAALCPDRIFYSNRRLNIEKQMTDNQYHKVIKDVLAFAKNENFNPEKFKRYKDYYAKNPSCSMEDVIAKVNLDLDYPFYENITTVEHPYELLVLVNKHNQLPSQFKQYNLVNMDRKYTLNDGKEYLLAAITYDNYAKMWNAAKQQGLSMRVVSAYRTEDYQRNLYSNKVKTSGKVYADNYSARAGHSEHQTGLAVDIGSTYTSFEYSQEFKWLQKHAHEYGFILRYPKGKEWITGYSYEPWHYRFVGVDAAKVIYEEGITFEEYYAKYISANEYR